MRVVVDTNVLLPSIRRTSRYRWLFDAILAGELTLVVSTAILLEYEEVIGRRTTPDIARNVLSALDLLPNVLRVDPRFNWRLIEADPDDNPFVDAYVSGAASALVTHDAHFNVLRQSDFPPVTVFSADAFRSRYLRGQE